MNPLDWSGTCNQECFWAYAVAVPDGLSYEITVTGYRYDWPGLTVEPTSPIPPIPAVPEPAAWLLFVVGLVVCVAARKLKSWAAAEAAIRAEPKEQQP